MTNRHLSRTIVMQSLFELDFRNKPEDDLARIITRNAKEFVPGDDGLFFMKSLGENVLRKRADIDNVIEKAAPDWPIDKISIIDRNVLRIGLYELIFSDRKEVPAKVAINEAIELAKSFGGDNSGKFVNGVLGAVYKEMGEPGKEEVSVNKKLKIPDIPFEKMPIERLVGAVVYAKKDGKLYLAFVHDIFGHWTLSKGHLAEGEEAEDGIKRVVMEEIGLNLKVKNVLGNNEYVASDPKKGKIRKQVSYYLASAPFEALNLKDSGGLDRAEWFKIGEIHNLSFYSDMLPIVNKALDILSKNG